MKYRIPAVIVMALLALFLVLEGIGVQEEDSKVPDGTFTLLQEEDLGTIAPDQSNDGVANEQELRDTAGSAAMAPGDPNQEKSFVRSKDPPLLETDPELLDFGEVLASEVLSRKLTIFNRGQSELALLGVQFTCGCTIPQVVFPNGEIVVPEKKGEEMIGTLQPGESAELEIEYKSANQAGHVKKTITILSNDPSKRKHVVPLIAKIRNAFTFEPRWLEFGNVEKGERVSRSTVIRSVGAGMFEVTGITGLPPHLSAEIEKLMDTDVPGVKLTVHLAKDAPVGTWNYRLKLDIRSERIRECDVPVSLKVLPPVRFLTGAQGQDDLLDFNILKQGKGAVKTIEIINKNPEIPYDVTEMSFETRYPDFIETRLVTEEDGRHYKIFVTVKPEIDCRFFKGVLTLKSNHPDLRKKEITVKGWISKD